MAVVGGASIMRVQFGWESVEDYTTGNLTLTAAETSFLSYCAMKGVHPLVIAAYGPPRVSIGTLTTTADTPAGSPAGTPIPVQPYTFTIDYPYCFAGDVNGGASMYTNRAAYYGSLITAADSSTIELAATTRVDIPAGATITVNRLRYTPPATDTDPSIAAYLRYATFLAEQIAAAGCQGQVALWNEYVWPHDPWTELSAFYDTKPPAITVSPRMKAILAAAQKISLPTGTGFQNGSSDKSGFDCLIMQHIPDKGAITSESVHPYGNNPEAHCWDYYAWGFNNNRPLPAQLSTQFGGTSTINDPWWEIVNPADQGSNMRNMAFVNDLGGGPPIWATECGLQSADDTAQARYLARRVASLWGTKVTPVPYVLDDGSHPGANTYAVAPSAHPRPSYYALQRMIAQVRRLAPGNDSSLVPTVSWPGGQWPLMITTINGAKGHAVMFLWQMTNGNPWTSIPSPLAVSAKLTVPAGTRLVEAIDVVTGQPVIVTNGAVPVTDNPVALRFAP